MVLFIVLILGIWIVINSLNNDAVKKIKADYIDIGYSNSLYEGKDKLDENTVQSLVDEYNKLEYLSQSSEDINFDKAITVTFVHNDQISAQLVIDDKGNFRAGDKIETYRIDKENDIYKEALKIYEQLKAQYN